MRGLIVRLILGSLFFALLQPYVTQYDHRNRSGLQTANASRYSKSVIVRPAVPHGQLLCITAKPDILVL
jgi:hypothetical protein